MTHTTRDLGDGWTEHVYVDHVMAVEDGIEHRITGTLVRGEGGELDIGIIRGEGDEPNGLAAFAETLFAPAGITTSAGEFLKLEGGTFDVGWIGPHCRGELHIEPDR